MSEGKVIVSGCFTVQVEQVDAFIDAFQKCIDITLTEAGCILYDISVNRKQNNAFVLYEEWESEETLAAHSVAPHVTTLLDTVRSFLAAPPVVNKYLVARQIGGATR